MYEPTTGRFDTLDPFFGDLDNPQSFHKHLYTHADPINGRDPTGMWYDSGHFYTVYVIARMSNPNLSHDDAKELAFWTQYPDEEKAYEAVFLVDPRNSADDWNTAANRVHTTVNSIKNMPYAIRVQRSLHQLNGHSGAKLTSNRNVLRKLYRRHARAREWESMGLILHAFGDSYAHTYRNPDTGEWTAYPTITGHAGAVAPFSQQVVDQGSGTDYIHERYADRVYPTYVRDLANLLGGRNGPAVEALINHMRPYKNADGSIIHPASNVPYTVDYESQLLAEYTLPDGSSYLSNEGAGAYRPEASHHEHQGRSLDWRKATAIFDEIHFAQQRPGFVDDLPIIAPGLGAPAFGGF